MARPAATRPAVRARPVRWPLALRYPLFARLWAGSIVSSVGTQMNNTAKLWVLYTMTHSAFTLGLDGLCFSVPIVVLPLVAGPVFAVNSISTLIVGVSFLPVGRARLPAADGDLRTGLGDGLHYAFAHRELLMLESILLAISTVALGTETLLPVLDHVLWHGGPMGYGMLRAAPGIAAVLTGVGVASIRPARHPARTIAFSMTSACAGLIAFSLAPLLAVGFILLALAFVAISVCQILVAIRVQQVTPERLRGAISGFNAITQSGLTGVAAAGMAFTAASLGARTVIMAVAAVTAITGLIAPIRTYRSD